MGVWRRVKSEFGPPKVWPGYAPVWGLDRDLLKNVIFLPKSSKWAWSKDDWWKIWGWSKVGEGRLRPSMGIRSRPLEKITYFLQNDEIFHVGAQIGCKSRKTTFYVFWLFTPLFRRFTLSGVVHREELFEIYRFISKILHFMASGSVLRFSIDFW